MPQFDLLNFPGQVFWLAVIFAFQYLLIAKFVVPAFKVLFDKRAKYISEQLKEAGILSKKSEELRLDYEQKLEEVKRKTAVLLKQAYDEIETTSQATLTECEAKLIEELRLHEKQAEAVQKQASKGLDEASLDLASEMIHKLTNVKVAKKKLLKYMN
jgi:F-type H+-transporting ATPase subunit b